MQNYLDQSTYAHQRQEQLLKQAAQNRLASAARENTQHIETSDGTSAPFYAPLLVRAGNLLVAFGHQLQDRYSDPLELPQSPMPSTESVG